MLHVSLARTDVGAIEELEADGFRVGRNDLHARLVAGSAVVGHQKAVAIHMKHGDHIFWTAPENLAHHRRAASSHTESHLNRLALVVFPGPVPFHSLQEVE